jgi:hypothetical protein
LRRVRRRAAGQGGNGYRGGRHHGSESFHRIVLPRPCPPCQSMRFCVSILLPFSLSCKYALPTVATQHRAAKRKSQRPQT